MAKRNPFSSVAEAFAALNPTRVNEEQIYREAGRAVISLSAIESDLTFLFGVLISPTLYEEAIKVFREVNNNFALKLHLVDLLVEKECTEAEKKRWRSISSTVSTHKGIRNLIAHQRMIHEPIEGAEPAWRVFLGPGMFDLSNRGRKLEGPDIKATADALEPIADKVYDFAKDLLLRQNPDALKKSG